MATQSADEESLPLLGEAFAVELANSRYRSDRDDLDFLDDPTAVRRWFDAAPDAAGLEVPAGLGTVAAGRLREVRDAARTLLTELADRSPELSAVAVERLHAASRQAPAHLALTAPAGEPPGWELHYDGPPEAVFLASVAAHCILFVAGDDAGRVRHCARPACPMIFVQQHSARRFCHESCAHSVRQARYYRTTKHARRGAES
ncbi:ABATE domain-containing protein [Microlunatus speluncae]|uniref:ABATE domain-containing protein n=1 Tax=Microlunatus speluncae TaxID=2594267 RepID=UPI0012666AAE|nr:ABATE domain-containing protein [Microlunatus speluncae]